MYNYPTIESLYIIVSVGGGGGEEGMGKGNLFDTKLGNAKKIGWVSNNR
jgi:hypothetical protein